jgi:hypothetical protein
VEEETADENDPISAFGEDGPVKVLTVQENSISLPSDGSFVTHFE